MKKTLLISTLLIAHLHSFAVIDTLRHYDINSAKTGTSISSIQYPKQYAAFHPIAQGYIKSIIVTLGGTSSTGTVTLHLFGHEGGTSFPSFQKDLITPLVAKKTASGIQKISVDLPTPLRIDNNQFYIKIENFSANVSLIKDNVSHTTFCSSSSGGNYYYEFIEDTQGKDYYTVNAFAIDVVMDYDALTSPRYLQDITASAGIDTTLSNSRISWGDINNDSYLDLLVGGKLYKNNKNNTFSDITASSGISNTPAWIASFIDMNNDGKEDIIFIGDTSAYYDSWLFLNNGNETFTKSTLKFSPTPALMVVLPITIADVNNDKYPDLWVSQYEVTCTDQNQFGCSHPHYLFLNDKNNGFTDASSSMYPSGFTFSPTRAAMWNDFNDDNQLDLYVCNYRLKPDELWKNNGDGTFTDIASTKGLDINSQGGSGHGTGCDWADYDNDGDMDLLLSQLAHPQWTVQYDHRPTTLYQNTGAPNYNFTDLNSGVNKGNIGIQYEETHAGAAWGDMNADGLTDFFITAFYGCRYNDMYIQKPDHSFEIKSFDYGVQDIASASDATMIDFDNDGKLDIACGAKTGDVFRLYKNKGNYGNNYLEIDLTSTSGNTFAIGAKVVVYAGGNKYTQYQMPYHGAGMSKGNRLFFGLGKTTTVDSVVVRWPNGTLKTEKFTNIPVNHFVKLTEGGKVVVNVSAPIPLLTSLQVFPNPATTDITFSYELEHTASVTLDIYSLLGQKISVVNEQQAGGKHTFQWQAKDAKGNKLAAGVYSYRMQINEEIKTGLVVIN